MIKFDFSTYVKNIEIDYKYKDLFIQKINSGELSFTKLVTKDEIDKIKTTVHNIKEKNQILVVIGIGGSYMGSYAINKIFEDRYKQNDIIYIGSTLTSKYIFDTLKYLEDKDFVIDVISKSGETFETKTIYKMLKDLVIKKYGYENSQEHIIITTSKNNGFLYNEAAENNYKLFELDENISGRYSIATVSHLLPMYYYNLDIEKFLEGYQQGLVMNDYAYDYAYIRFSEFNKKKYVENFVVYEEYFAYYTEWLKQLFSESEGKEGCGLLPISVINTRDLHSLGQYIEDGNDIMFETVIKVVLSDKINALNNLISNSVSKTHFASNKDNIIITLEKLDMFSIGKLSAFFLLSACFSSYLFGVDPFNQPGVEKYKKQVMEDLK